MTSEYTRVQFGTLEQAQADFGRAYNSFQETLSRLDSQLRGSLAHWNSQARGAYDNFKAAWDTASADLTNVLNQLGAVVGTAHANYTSAEAANAARWGG